MWKLLPTTHSTNHVKAFTDHSQHQPCESFYRPLTAPTTWKLLPTTHSTNHVKAFTDHSQHQPRESFYRPLTAWNGGFISSYMWLNVYLGKVNLETCWPVVYLVGRLTCLQGLLVTHVLTGPALLHSPIIADQSQASWLLWSPPLSPSQVQWCWAAVTGSPWIPPQWVTTAFGGPSITTHLPPAHQSMS